MLIRPTTYADMEALFLSLPIPLFYLQSPIPLRYHFEGVLKFPFSLLMFFDCLLFGKGSVSLR